MGADQHLTYDRLVEISERELELVRSGQLDELVRIQEERSALTESLPAVPPASARDALQRAARAQTQTTAELAARMREIKRELSRIDTGRSTVRRYGASAAARSRVDHAA